MTSASMDGGEGRHDRSPNRGCHPVAVVGAPGVDVRRRRRAFPLVGGLLVRAGMTIVGPGMVGWRFGLCPVLSTVVCRQDRSHRRAGGFLGLILISQLPCFPSARARSGTAGGLLPHPTVRVDRAHRQGRLSTRSEQVAVDARGGRRLILYDQPPFAGRSGRGRSRLRSISLLAEGDVRSPYLPSWFEAEDVC